MNKHILSLAIAALITAGAHIAAHTSAPTEKDALTTDADRKAIHFFDSIAAQGNLVDSMTAHVSRWAALTGMASNDTVVKRAADRFALLTCSAGENTAFAASEAAEDVLKLSQQRNYALYAVVLRSLLAAGTPDSIRCRYLLESTLKNMPGTPAADFDFVLTDGSRHNTAQLRGKMLMLYFYDPECDDCHRLAADLGCDDTINRLIADGKLTVTALAPEHEDADGSFLPSGWLDADDNGAISTHELYDIEGYPCIYLIDTNGNVVFKDASTVELLKYLRII